MNDSREDEVLKELQAKESKIIHLSAEMERLVCENTILRQKVDALLRQVFGAKSEQIDQNQLLFFYCRASLMKDPPREKNQARKPVRLFFRRLTRKPPLAAAAQNAGHGCLITYPPLKK